LNHLLIFPRFGSGQAGQEFFPLTFHLYNAKSLCQSLAMNLRNLVAFSLGLFLLTGCSTTITNLTPSQLPRSQNNLYPFEVALDTTQRSIVDDTVKASVLVGLETYPMQATPMLKNRWDTLVPIPAGTNFLHYRYKFDYQYNAVPQRRASSILSPMYTLEIIK
jgi:hypothetical protein